MAWLQDQLYDGRDQTGQMDMLEARGCVIQFMRDAGLDWPEIATRLNVPIGSARATWANWRRATRALAGYYEHMEKPRAEEERLAWAMASGRL